MGFAGLAETWMGPNGEEVDIGCAYHRRSQHGHVGTAPSRTGDDRTRVISASGSIAVRIARPT